MAVSGVRPSVALLPCLSGRLRPLRVVLHGGLAYWSVVDDSYELVETADLFLRDLRIEADRAESTTRMYASELALFLDWVESSDRDLERVARELLGFVLMLRTTPVTRRGRGYGQLRSPGRVNHVLAVVREFYKHLVGQGRVNASVLSALFEVGDDRFLPAELRAEDGALRYRLRPRHQLRADRSGRGRRCELEEWEALLHAASCWRDRFLLVLLWFTGLRIGEALGLRRSDMHLPDSAGELGCVLAGAHVHVVPRENPNGARAKGGRERVVPFARYAVSYYDLYLNERDACRPAAGCDFVFVNLFAEPLGAPMRYGRVAQLFRQLSREAGVAGAVTPHMLRHAAGSALTAADGLDVAQEILGHRSITSTQIYVHASAARQREAAERLAQARGRTGGGVR
jgi:site-specific recombinase XerD